MSKLINYPAAGRLGQLRTFTSKDLVVMVDRTVIPEPTYVEYIEFLELVYGVQVKIEEKLCGTWIKIPRTRRSEAGIRVAGWLYNIEYQLLHHR